MGPRAAPGEESGPRKRTAHGAPPAPRANLDVLCMLSLAMSHTMLTLQARGRQRRSGERCWQPPQLWHTTWTLAPLGAISGSSGTHWGPRTGLGTTVCAGSAVLRTLQWPCVQEGVCGHKARTPAPPTPLNHHRTHARTHHQPPSTTTATCPGRRRQRLSQTQSRCAPWASSRATSLRRPSQTTGKLPLYAMDE